MDEEPALGLGGGEHVAEQPFGPGDVRTMEEYSPLGHGEGPSFLEPAATPPVSQPSMPPMVPGSVRREGSEDGETNGVADSF
jgi:hypothetical protein